MAVSGWLRRSAAAAPVPTFVIQGMAQGPAGDADGMRADPRLAIVDSPRHATVLLIAGDLPGALQRPAALVHDLLPHPRATVWWAPSEAVPAVAVTRRLEEPADVGAALQAVHRSLLLGDAASEEPWLAGSMRQPWRGVGPYGHGGSGMTGGTPYGRRLADRADDLRDGLKLDVLPVVVGPFFTGLPTGLVLRVSLQGDLVQAVEVLANPFVDAAGVGLGTSVDVFQRAGTEPVRLRSLEATRLRSHLRWLAGGLRLLGLAALGQRALRLSIAEPETVISDAPALARLVARRRVTRAVSEDGALTASQLAALNRVADVGLVLRAAGVRQDARAHDVAYVESGFEAVVQTGANAVGGAKARWQQYLDELHQSAELAVRAGQRIREPGPRLELPVADASQLLPLLPDLLVGSEWGDAVAIVGSLGLDLRAAASRMVAA